MSHLQLTRQRLGRWAALAALSTSIILAAPSALAITGKFVPANGILMTIGQDVDSINGYTSAMGTAPAGVTNYVGIVNLDGLNSNGDAGAGRNNISELANTYPTSALVIGVSMNGQVDAVAAGSYNANIDTLLHKLASYNRPVFLRWAYEVDGPWNGHSPNGVIQSFRYVHGRVAALGYSNRIAMVWQTMSYCPIDSNIAQWYPGDQYVDWIGLSYFAPQDCNAREVRKTADFAVAHNKPLMINESTPQRFAIGELTYSADAARGSGRVNKTASQIWNEWFVGYFEFMDTYSANIKAVTYINANWNAQSRWASGNEGYWGDSRVQANATIKANWSAELNSGALTGETFIHKASSDLFSKLGFGGSVSSTPKSSSVPSSTPKSSVATGNSSSNTGTNGVFGMTSSGTVYHLDGGQTASFVYLCVNGDCRSAIKVGNRYERSYSPVNASTSYSIEFKVQDNATGQCLTSASVKPGQAVASTACYKGSVAISSIAASSKPASSKAASSVLVVVASSKAAVSSTQASSKAATCQSDTNPSHVISGRRTEFTQSWCDTVCVTYVGNNTACLNRAGTLVSNASICSDPANAKEAMIDIEYNLGIDIDDAFIAASGYQGAVPSLNPRMKTEDVRKYFVALLGSQKGSEFTNALNLNGDGWIDRNEASQAKGADPRQVLNTGFGCGLSTDDIMAYLGLYMGDGAIDKYAGDLDPSVKEAMLRFTRSWQPGVSAQACEYRGGCGTTQSSAKSSVAASKASSKAASSVAPSNNCPASHPYWSTSCQRCFLDLNQAKSASCN